MTDVALVKQNGPSKGPKAPTMRTSLQMRVCLCVRVRAEGHLLVQYLPPPKSLRGGTQRKRENRCIRREKEGKIK